MAFSSSIRRAAAPRFSNYILSLQGPDRVGLVNELCDKVVIPCQGVIERTLVNSLGGGVTLMSKVQLPNMMSHEVEPLMKQVFTDFHVNCRRASDSTFSPLGKTSMGKIKSPAGAQTRSGVRQTRTFSIMGPDCADILERLARFTQEHQMDVLNLDSEVVSGTHVGYDIFNAQITVSLPHGHDLDSVFAHRLGNELGVELTLSNE